jgi:hypothetical protein
MKATLNNQRHDYGVLNSNTYQHVLDVALTVLQVSDNFLEVLQQQVLVVQQLLSLDEAGVLVLSNVFTLLQDCHGVVMFLTEEQDVEACLLVILHRERKCTFSEHRHD